MIATEYLLPSPVEPLRLRGSLFYIKRDDLIHPAFSGNKFRKLQSLIDTPADRYDTLVSYGGVQSNAMLSLAHLAAMKGWRFVYLVKKVPTLLYRRPGGNFAAALSLGMEVRELGYGNFYEKVARFRRLCGEGVLFVPQGGADPSAKKGVALLAQEILAWKRARGFERLSVVTPSGTGTTAHYLRETLPKEVGVYTVPAVGDAETLRRQWRALGASTPPFATILPDAKWPFAKPKAEFLRIWQELLEAGVAFDLIYAPKTWLALLRWYERLPKPVLYIHSGGVMGNQTQLERYAAAGL